jgi:hypothetical protein
MHTSNEPCCKTFYAVWLTNNSDGCCSKCQNDKKCDAWTWHNKHSNASKSHGISNTSFNCLLTDDPLPGPLKTGVVSGSKKALVPTPAPAPPTPAEAKQPHIVMVLVDDWGWANAGWHRPAGFAEVQTPNLDALVRGGIELDRAYAFKVCSPTRSSFQSGRLPVHVNIANDCCDVANPADPVSGFAAIPRNMTGIATKLREVGYATHQVGKW